MLKILLISILILLIISLLFIMLIKRRKVAYEVFSIQTFLGSNSNNLMEDDFSEQKASLLDKINDFFKESKDTKIDDDDEDNGGSDDAGE